MFNRIHNKRIINEIISNATPAVILMTASDGDAVGFYSELNNFYKRSYWMNPNCEDFYSFAISFAKKVFADEPEEYDKLLRFKHCSYGFNKDSIIIKEALKKIASVYGDCLLVLDNLEDLRGDFDFKIIEFLLKNSPRNLKILLVDSEFLNINYGMFAEQCPKLIVPDDDTEKESFVLTGGADEEETELLTYAAMLRFADKGFIESIGKTYIMEDIAKKRPDYVFKRGQDGYCINEKCVAIGKKAGLDIAAIEKKAERDYYRYLRNANKNMEAFIFALNRNQRKPVSDVVVSLVNDGTYTFELCRFVNANKESLDILFDKDWDNKLIGLEFIAGLQLYYSENYEDSIALLSQVTAAAEKNTKLEIDAIYILLKNLAKLHRYRQLMEKANALIESRKVNGELDVDNFEAVLCRLPEFMKAGGLPVNRENCKYIENLLLQDKYKDRYWYDKALQLVAELNFDWGSYGKATAYIRELQERIPFYIMPYKLMGFYYYMGDMPKAVSMAKKALEEELSNNIENALADVYILLAKTCIYFNKFGEGLNYIDEAIKNAGDNDNARYLAYSIRAIILAKMGKKEYARDYAMLYSKHAEINSPRNVSYLYGVTAYCAFRQNDFDAASVYANKCLKEASARSPIWLLAVAIAINVLITKDDVANAENLTAKLFRTCRVYGMNAIVLDYYECFERLFRYAKSIDLDVEYVEEMEEKYREKLVQISANGELCVKLMGTTSVTVAGKELNWKTKKAKELFLMYIWHRGEGIDRNFILSTLWADYVYTSAINNLKTTNNIIRNTLNAANVIHKLEYANGKYMLVMENIRCDYLTFAEKLEAYSDDLPLKNRVEICKDLLNLFVGDFAEEVNLPIFRKHGDGLREKLMLDIIKLISELIEAGEIIEARRLIGAATKSDVNNGYEALIAEQENKIAAYFERKEQ